MDLDLSEGASEWGDQDMSEGVQEYGNLGKSERDEQGKSRQGVEGRPEEEEVRGGGTLTRMGSTIYFVVRATTFKKNEVPTHPVSALNNTNLGPLYAVTGPHHGIFHCTVSVHDSVSRS